MPYGPDICYPCEGCGDCMTEIDAFWFGIEREMFLNNITGILNSLIYKIRSYTDFLEAEKESKQYSFGYSQKVLRGKLKDMVDCWRKNNAK